MLGQGAIEPTCAARGALMGFVRLPSGFTSASVGLISFQRDNVVVVVEGGKVWAAAWLNGWITGIGFALDCRYHGASDRGVVD